MLILATFFPASDDSKFDVLIVNASFLRLILSLFVNSTHKSIIFRKEFFQTTVDLGDLIGLYVSMTKIAGKCEIKYLIAGVGWASAELVMTK